MSAAVAMVAVQHLMEGQRIHRYPIRFPGDPAWRVRWPDEILADAALELREATGKPYSLGGLWTGWTWPA